MNEMTRREILAGGSVLAISAAVGKMGHAEDVGVETTKVADRLTLINSCSGQRFKMRLVKEMPMEATGDGTVPIMDSVLSCRNKEAVAFLGFRGEADGKEDRVKISVEVDGYAVLKDIRMEEMPAAVPGRLRLEDDPFLAVTPEGAKVGLFLPNGTNVRVRASVPGPIKVHVALRTAVYALEDVNSRNT